MCGTRAKDRSLRTVRMRRAGSADGTRCAWIAPVKLRWIAIAVAVAIADATSMVVFVSRSLLPLSPETLRQTISAALSERLDRDVQLQSLSVRMVPFHAQGAGLTVRSRGR